MSIFTPRPKIKPAPATGNPKLTAVSNPRPAGWGLGLRITIDGALFVSLSLLIGLAAVNTGENLLYLIFSVMLAMLGISGFMARNNLRRICATRHYPLEFHANQPQPGLIEITNQKRFTHTYALGVEDVAVGPVHYPAERQHVVILRSYAMMVKPRGELRGQVSINLPIRGLYELQSINLISLFPFGFFERVKQEKIKGQLLVYPRLLPNRVIMPLCPTTLGDIESNRKGQGTSLYGLRDYEAGDPARFIHWKQSAKGTGVKLMEFEQEENRVLRLMLDLRCPEKIDDMLMKDFEKAVSLTATLARLLLKAGATVGLWTSMGNVPFSAGPVHQQRIMRALAQVGPQVPSARPVIPEKVSGGQLVELWIEYQSGQGRAARPGFVIRRHPAHHVIDARKVRDDEQEWS